MEDGPFSEFPMELELENIYNGYFPHLNASESIDYFITATNSVGNSSYHPNAGWHVFESPNIILGDINGDEILNVLDIVLMINMILANEYTQGADVNQDNSVDILDVVLMVNILVGGLP